MCRNAWYRHPASSLVWLGARQDILEYLMDPFDSHGEAIAYHGGKTAWLRNFRPVRIELPGEVMQSWQRHRDYSLRARELSHAYQVERIKDLHSDVNLSQSWNRLSAIQLSSLHLAQKSEASLAALLKVTQHQDQASEAGSGSLGVFVDAVRKHHDALVELNLKDWPGSTNRASKPGQLNHTVLGIIYR